MSDSFKGCYKVADYEDSILLRSSFALDVIRRSTCYMLRETA